jgi:hypothetical protein
MIRHTVLLTFSAAATDADLDGIVESLQVLPAKIGAIATYTVARDLRLDPTNASIMVVADFDSVADYREYSTHPDHVAVINQQIKPILAHRSAIQVELA